MAASDHAAAYSPELATNLALALFGVAVLTFALSGALAARKQWKRWRARWRATFRRVDQADEDEADESGEDGDAFASARRLETLRKSIRADPQLASDPATQAGLRKAEADAFYLQAMRSDAGRATKKKARTKERRGTKGKRGPGEDWL